MNAPKPQPPSNIVRVGGGFLVVMVSLVAFVGITMAVADVVDYFQVQNYESAQGTVTKAWVVAARDVSSQEPESRAVADIDYTFDGQAMSVSRLPLGPVGSRQAADAAVAEYPAGGVVTLYVDPEDPDDPTIDNDPPLMHASTLGFLTPSLLYFGFFLKWLVPAVLNNRRATLGT